MRSSQRHTEGENPSRTSKLPAGGVVLLVLVGLLAAALIVIYRLSFLLTNQTLQTLKDENEALRRNLSGERCPTCEAGWEPHGGNCYYFSTTKSSWTDSRRSCADLGSDLVKIDSREEQMFLELRVRPMMKNDGEKFWIGLTDSVEEGKWFWVDGLPLNPSLSFWMPWEPDNQNKTDPGGEDCGGMGKKGGADDLMCWFDQLCGLRRRSICEKPADLPKPEC